MTEYFTPQVRRKLEHSYGAPFDLMAPWFQDYETNPYTVVENDTHAVVFNQGEDVVGTEGQMPFLFLDMVFDLSPVLHSLRNQLPMNIRIEDKGVACAVLPIQNGFVPDVWARSLHIKPTYLIGKKYQDLSVEHTFVPFAEYPEMLDPWVELKRVQYPDVNVHEFINLVHNGYHCSDEVMFTYVREASIPGRPLVCVLVSIFGEGGRVICPFIYVSNDAVIRQKHMSYVVGHVEVIRQAWKLNQSLVDFGLYFPYKRPMEFQEVWRPGLRYI